MECPLYKEEICVLLLQWRHNGHDSVSNHQPPDCLFNRLFRRRSKKTSKLRVTGLCAGNSPGTGEFPAQMASNAENVSIWWRHHDSKKYPAIIPYLRNYRHKQKMCIHCHATMPKLGLVNFIWYWKKNLIHILRKKVSLETVYRFQLLYCLCRVPIFILFAYKYVSVCMVYIYMHNVYIHTFGYGHI